MLTSPALLSMVSSRSASTRAISTRSVGALSRPGSTGALLSSRLATESSLAASGTGSSLGLACTAPRDGGASMDAAKSGAGAGGAGVAGRGAVAEDSAVAENGGAVDDATPARGTLAGVALAGVAAGAGGAAAGVPADKARICAISAVAPAGTVP